MSELAIFKGGKVPAHIRKLGRDKTTLSLMGNAGGGKRISIEGGVWRLLSGGQEIAQREERTLNVVIVAASEHVGRIFYEGTYVKGESAVPTCWSSDGVTPDASVQNPQSDKCETCPHNIKGSGPNGTRACRFFQRLAVVLENDLEGDVYQLQLPATSLFGEGEPGKWPLQAYARLLGAQDVPVIAVITEMKFDTTAAVPKVTFKPVRVLEEDELETVLRQGQTDTATRAIKFHVAQIDKGKIDDEGEGDEPKAKSRAEDTEDVEDVEIKPKRTRKAAKPEPEPEPIEDEEDDYEDDEEEETPPPAPKRRKPEPEPEPVEDEDDEEEDEPVVKSRKKTEGVPSRKQALLDALDEWDD